MIGKKNAIKEAKVRCLLKLGHVYEGIDCKNFEHSFCI